MAYQILKEFFPHDEMAIVRNLMMKQHTHRQKLAARSGFTLTHEGWLFDTLQSLASNASQAYGQVFIMMPHWSSCQLVEPSAGLEFPPHQDIVALEVKQPTDKGCVFWIPLDDITPTMPTLAVCRDEVGMLPHIDDGRGLSIIDPAHIDSRWSWKVLSDAKMGDVVRMDAFTVHRTFVPNECTRARLSLDVRAKPQ